MSDVLRDPLIFIFNEPFSTYLQGQLHQQPNEHRLYYISGIVVLTITASVRLRFLLFHDRHVSLVASGCENADTLASYGLFIPSPGSPLRCFHCDAVVYASVSAASGANLDAICAAHKTASPACYLAKLACLHQVDFAGASALQSDARRFQTVMRRLRQVLDVPLFYTASAYGFDTNYLRLCAGRHFMRNDCATVDKPGDLLQLAQDFEVHQTPDSQVRNIDLLRILEVVGAAPNTPGSAAPPEPSAQQQQPPPPTLQPSPAVRLVAADNSSADASSAVMAAITEADDRCIQCHSRSRNRVTLPCAHFLLCDRCLESLTRCPKCSKTIAATVTAFIT